MMVPSKFNGYARDGRRLYRFDLGGDAPDMSGVNAAAQANAEIGKDALAWYKAEAARTAPLRDQVQQSQIDVSNAQLAAMKANTDIANDYYDYQKGTFRPLEQGIVANAQNYDTAARRESEANAAAADLSKQYGLQQAAAQRQQASMGVNPNSGRAQALASQGALGLAAATAGSMNAARKNVEQQGYARRMDAANLGRNLASNQANSQNIALNAGNAAAATGSQALQTSQQGTALVGQGLNTAMAANQSAGNLYGQAYQLSAQSNANTMGGLGQLAGMGLSAYQSGMFSSSKTLKHNKRPMDEKQALKGLNSVPVEEWDYKPGAGDGGTHIGPYAQDVQRELGDAVAPGGQAIDMHEMGRANSMAIRELTARVASLGRELARLEG